MNDETSLRDKVLDNVSVDGYQRTVPISFPTKVYKRFRTWSDENANGCYWLAIEKLLDNYDKNSGLDLTDINDKVDFLTEVVANLEKELIVLRNEKNNPKELRSFGRKEE